ncbi:MAG: hypothetical protein Q4B50_05930 [Bacillota bacterium]|nr:hypothetical protein [Bacillota bacterium]
MPNQPNFFEERYTKYFPLMKAQFPDYDRYKDLESEPLEKTEQMKYQLAQGMKKMEEIYQLWQSSQNYENASDSFFEELQLHCEEAENHLLRYAKMAKEESGESKRLHISKALRGTVGIYKELPQMIKISQENSKTEERQQFIGERPQLDIKEAERFGKYKIMQGGLKRLETDAPEENFYKQLRSRMQESYDNVLWNSTEYKAMFTALKDFLNCEDAAQQPNKIRALDEATRNYINLKKDIPLTENGKTRLSLARDLLNGTQLLVDGLEEKEKISTKIRTYDRTIGVQVEMMQQFAPKTKENFLAMPKNESFTYFTAQALTILILKKELEQNGRDIHEVGKSLEKYIDPMKEKVSSYLQDKVDAAVAANDLEKGMDDLKELINTPELLYQDFMKAQQKPPKKSHEEKPITTSQNKEIKITNV